MARFGRRQPHQPIINVGGRFQPPFPLQRIVQVNRAVADATRRRSVFQPLIRNIPPAPGVAPTNPVSGQRSYQVGIAVEENKRQHKLFKPFTIKLPILAAPSIALYLTADVRISGSTYEYKYPLNNLQASGAPGFNDDGSLGYAPGSIWIDKTNQDAYICIRSTPVSAVWKKMN